MDYGRPVQFGIFVIPDATQPLRPLEQAAKADELGIDLIGIQDHPYQHRFHDTWTLLTAIAMRTKRVTVFPDVVGANLDAGSFAELVIDHGFDTFIIGEGQEDGLRRFLEGIAPKVRELVAAAREAR